MQRIPIICLALACASTAWAKPKVVVDVAIPARDNRVVVAASYDLFSDAIDKKDVLVGIASVLARQLSHDLEPFRFAARSATGADTNADARLRFRIFSPCGTRLWRACALDVSIAIFVPANARSPRRVLRNVELVPASVTSARRPRIVGERSALHRKVAALIADRAFEPLMRRVPFARANAHVVTREGVHGVQTTLPYESFFASPFLAVDGDTPRAVFEVRGERIGGLRRYHYFITCWGQTIGGPLLKRVPSGSRDCSLNALEKLFPRSPPRRTRFDAIYLKRLWSDY